MRSAWRRRRQASTGAWPTPSHSTGYARCCRIIGGSTRNASWVCYVLRFTLHACWWYTSDGFAEEERAPMIAQSAEEMSSHEDLSIVDPDAVRRIQEHPIDDDLTVQVAEIFKALSEPTRVRILHALLHAELCVGDLAAVLEMSESAVSHQLRLLRSLRVVRARRDGKLVFYTLDDEHVARLFQISLEHLGHE